MTSEKVIEKAYGNIPKDVGFNFDTSWIPTRSVKYYWLILVRKITR